ncbi:MAG TPA: AAA family ATPase, partial [Thermomicrobiaceae bacterium]|nr:AAA family ATPase [Thermomicrobiaceae bacterium]
MPPTNPATGSTPHSPGLIGREPEQAMLRQALQRLLDGEGGLVLIDGEAGIGKTTLLRWLAREAEAAGALVLWGHAYDNSVMPPYGLWTSVARAYQATGLAPDLPSFLDDHESLAALGSQQRLLDEIARFFQEVAAVRPLLVLLEDVHWADQASLDLLRHFARRAAGPRPLLVASYRREEMPRGHPLYQLVPLLVREAEAERIHVPPLSQPDLRALIERRYELAATDLTRLERYLEERAEGNPLYAGELLRTLEEERLLCPAEGGWALGDLTLDGVPPLLRQVIAGRVGRLGEGARPLLAVAAT